MNRLGQGLGDIMPGCFSVPQNPFFTPGNCPMFSPGNGIKSGTVPAVGTSSVPTSLPVSSSWMMNGGGGSSVTTNTASITPGSPAATSLPKATTQASPSITQTSGPVSSGDSKINVNPAILLQTLPNINLGRPVNLKCEDGGIASWINQNPMLAGLALVGLFFTLNKG